MQPISDISGTTKTFLKTGEKAARIVFMGTPEFAVASLEALVTARFDVVGVITAPDKPAGRGLQLQQSAVKKRAVELGLPVLQPEKLRDSEFLKQLSEWKPDVQVVVAFRMLPEMVWNLPPGGTINVHASLLPQYRGAAPINWAIINGEKESGVTTFKLKHQIDTGDVLLQERVAIGAEETAGTLHDKLKETGAQLLVKTLRGLHDGTVKEVPQMSVEKDVVTNESTNKHTGEEGLKHAPKLSTDTCKIDWTKSVDDVYNLIRGLAPYPTAFTELGGKKLKIYGAKKDAKKGLGNPGSIITDNKTFLKFACADGFISLTELQLEGKKKLYIEEFLRGYRSV